MKIKDNSQEKYCSSHSLDTDVKYVLVSYVNIRMIFIGMINDGRHRVEINVMRWNIPVEEHERS